MPIDTDRLRDELREIGDRRLDLNVATVKLEEDTTRLVRRAKGVLGMREIARLVGLHRSSLYTTYGA